MLNESPGKPPVERANGSLEQVAFRVHSDRARPASKSSQHPSALYIFLQKQCRRVGVKVPGRGAVHPVVPLLFSRIGKQREAARYCGGPEKDELLSWRIVHDLRCPREFVVASADASRVGVA